MDNIKEKLYQQLAIDYCCTVSDIKDNKNHFTEYKKREGRRQFEESDECILKVMVVNGKLVFTGKKQVVDVCSQKFSNRSGSWFMDVSNFRELDKILAGEEEFHAIEVMACKGGCIGGGGQPYHHGNFDIIKTRAEAIQNLDYHKEIRASHKNPYVVELYEKELGEPYGEKAHKIFHTHYVDRKIK